MATWPGIDAPGPRRLMGEPTLQDWILPAVVGSMVFGFVAAVEWIPRAVRYAKAKGRLSPESEAATIVIASVVMVATSPVWLPVAAVVVVASIAARAARPIREWMEAGLPPVGTRSPPRPRPDATAPAARLALEALERIAGTRRPSAVDFEQAQAVAALAADALRVALEPPPAR